MASVVVIAALLLPIAFCAAMSEGSAEGQAGEAAGSGTGGEGCTVFADERLAGPVRAIVAEYGHRTGARADLRLLPAAELEALVAGGKAGADVAVCMAKAVDGPSAVGAIVGAKKVAWKHPTGEPVWAAALTRRPHAAGLCGFFGGPTGHRLWAESKMGFRIASGKTSAEAYNWVVKHRTKHSYPMTAMRMLAECGGIREGICIDVGCGSGLLDVELAKRSNLSIIGLDIDPNVKPLFEENIRKAGLEKRISFVQGDAQKMPFPDNYADVIVSRGTLTFIPDKAKCLREIHRVLKPTGVAFVGGRYVYTPQPYRISTEALRRIVRESGVPGATVIDARGQWVKIVGPKAPAAAGRSGVGPHMLAGRFVADYAIVEGKCLLICGSDGGLQQALQRGFAAQTSMAITALYPSEKLTRVAAERIRKAGLAGRIRCEVGSLAALPFEEGSFDAIAGVGPVLIFQKDRAKAMREIRRVLRDGGVALVGGRYLHMPASRKVSSDALRKIAAGAGIPSVRVIDDMGQWVEIRKGTSQHGARD